MNSEKQLDFWEEEDQPYGRRSQKAIRRSRKTALRSERAEALAPSTDRLWFELPPLDAYAEMDNDD